MDEHVLESYQGMGTDTLHKSLAECYRQILETKADTKAYASASRDAVKELEGRMEAILVVLREHEDDAPSDG